MVFDTVLAFDHVRHRILIIANARITPDEDLESLYQFACAKIEFLERELEREPVARRSAAGQRHSSSSNPDYTRERFEERVRTAKEAHRRRRHLSGRCCRSASRPMSPPIRSRSTGRCATSTRRRTCISSAWAACPIVGSSPEMLVRVEGSRVETHPIAGTRPRGQQPRRRSCGWRES